MIDPDDLNLMQVIDEPAEVVDAIFDHYEKRGFEPSPRSAKPSSTCKARESVHVRIHQGCTGARLSAWLRNYSVGR